LLFAVGILGVGLIGVPGLAGSAAHALSAPAPLFVSHRKDLRWRWEAKRRSLPITCIGRTGEARAQKSVKSEPAALWHGLHGPQVWSTVRSGDHRGFQKSAVGRAI